MRLSLSRSSRRATTTSTATATALQDPHSSIDLSQLILPLAAMLKEDIACVDAVPRTGNGPEHRPMSRRDRDAVASALSVLRVLCCACRDVANLDPVIAYTLFYEMRRMNTGRLRPVFLKDHCPRGLDLINTAVMMPFNSAVANSEGSVFAAGVLQWIERPVTVQVMLPPLILSCGQYLHCFLGREYTYS